MDTNQQPQRKVRSFSMKREMISLEKDVPLPENPAPAGGREVYPLRGLEVNDSFSFAYASSAKTQMLKSALTSIRAHTKLHPEKQFVARIIEGEGVIRVWRISDANNNEAQH